MVAKCHSDPLLLPFGGELPHDAPNLPERERKKNRGVWGRRMGTGGGVRG